MSTNIDSKYPTLILSIFLIIKKIFSGLHKLFTFFSKFKGYLKSDLKNQPHCDWFFDDQVVTFVALLYDSTNTCIGCMTFLFVN